MRHRSLERCAAVLSSVRKTRRCTLDFLASKAEERAIGRGASAQGRCVAASRVGKGSRVAATDPKESVDGSESGRWMGSLRMPQRSLRYVGDVRSVRSCGSALELPSERATRSASSLFQPCSPVRMKGRPVQPARSGPSFLSCGTPCTASLKLPLTPVRLPQTKGVGHPRAGAGRDTRCCSAATDQRTGSALGPWSLGALGHRFV